MVSGMSYHPHCFTCRECGLVIDKKFYTTEDKKFLCEHDYKVSNCEHDYKVRNYEHDYNVNNYEHFYKVSNCEHE